MIAPARIWLIRHGETEWSLSGRHTGGTDIGLTRNGEEQARALAPCLSAASFAHVLTSPSVRARRTCELAGLGAAAVVEPLLAEWDYGDYEGRRSDEIRNDRPGWDVFQDGCPGGEDPASVGRRADRLLVVLSKAGGDAALFSHGQFGCVLAARWIGLPAADGQHFSLGPASLSILGARAGHPDVRAIALWNGGPASLSKSP